MTPQPRYPRQSLKYAWCAPTTIVKRVNERLDAWRCNSGHDIVVPSGDSVYLHTYGFERRLNLVCPGV